MNLHIFLSTLIIFAITINSVIIYYQNKQCGNDVHTEVYDSSWDSNRNSSFFDPLTFGIYLYPDDPCQIIKTTTKFRKNVNKYIKCQGERCIDELFKCNVGNSRSCYHVEHIFDKNRNTVYENRNIAANLVMAWSSWNMEVGRLPYRFSQKEKEQVYGDHFYKAKKIMDFCNNITDVGSEQYILLDHPSYISLIVLIFILVLYECGLAYTLCKKQVHKNIRTLDNPTELNEYIL
jgi:hypothetical protein